MEGEQNEEKKNVKNKNANNEVGEMWVFTGIRENRALWILSWMLATGPYYIWNAAQTNAKAI